MSIPFTPANFGPTMLGYTGQQPFRFWCQKVLPLVYDDSLSYYELLNKVVDYLNNTISDVANVETNVDSLNTSFTNLQGFVNDNVGEAVSAFNALETFVNDYFTNLDVQEEINTKLDVMATDGTLTRLLIETGAIPDAVSEWLEENMTTTSPPVDKSLSIADAAADAKVTGHRIENVEQEIVNLLNENSYVWSEHGSATYEDGWRTGYYGTSDGSYHSSNQYITSLYYIVFPDNAVLFNIKAPTDYAISVVEYESDGTYVKGYGSPNPEASGAIDSLTLAVTPTHKYLVSLGKFNSDASDYLNASFISSILLKYYTNNSVVVDPTLTVSGDAADAKVTGDYINELTEKINEFYVTKEYDWSYIATSDYALGWRTGYFSASTGVASSSNLYIRTVAQIKFGNETKRIHVKAPSGYCIAAFRWKSDGTYEQRFGDMDNRNTTGTTELTIDNNGTYFYQFCVGRFTTSSGDTGTDHLTEEFIGQIVCEYDEASTKYNTGREARNYFKVHVNTVPSGDGTTSDNNEGSLNYYVNAVIALPENYTAYGDACPIIMLCHGQSASVNNTDKTWFNESSDFLRLLGGFLNAGFAVFDVGSTNPDNPDIAFADWGNPALMSAYIKAWDYIKANYNVENKMYIYSESMGTIAALNFASWYAGDVIAMINSAPRTDLSVQLTQTTEIGGYAINDSIRLRYGFSGDTIPEKYAGYDHYAQITEVNNVQRVFKQMPPIKVLAGGNDSPSTGLPKTRAYYNALIKNGNNVAYREVDGVNHHDMCYLIPGSTLQECVDWFNRFTSN